MMNITIDRRYKKNTYTIGNLYIDGVFFCNTLEDQDRGLSDKSTLSEIKSKKVHGQTAIPTGTYDIRMDIQSPRFSKKAFYWNLCRGKLPRIMNVPGFDGVLIHVGNIPADTEGCILVGKNSAVGQVLDSTNTFKSLYSKLNEAYKKGEQIKITIK